MTAASAGAPFRTRAAAASTPASAVLVRVRRELMWWFSPVGVGGGRGRRDKDAGEHKAQTRCNLRAASATEPLIEG